MAIPQSTSINQISPSSMFINKFAATATKKLTSLWEKPAPPEVTVTTMASQEPSADHRVKILVPDEYKTEFTTEGIIDIGCIIFPYTPSIGYDFKADYTSTNPTHSNFTIYSYKYSSVSAINISGKFTVTNQEDAKVYLGTVHLLRALTKMQFGSDTFSGSPPPICKLMAYGEFMLQNIPVAINTVKIELPETVDYFHIEKSIFGAAAVPIISTISVTCIPMYSRQEMQKATVTGWLTNTAGRNKGYL